ncbi:MAG TPA: S41 family peptidase, partial [Planctomycetota bacterium]|nr:S41 family peptidase [Planctomycetota bacterium]
AFVRIVDRILRAFGDGHSRVEGVRPVSDTFLPFLVQEVAGGHVAFHADRSGLVDAERPFVTAIDGVPLERWLGAAKTRATQGSPTMQAREAERLLRDLGDLRVELKLAASEKVTVTVRGKPGTRDVTLDTTKRKPAYGAWPRTETRLLDGNVGYLRIALMAGETGFLDGLDASMQTFRATKGLVVDVRGNGGGSRDALRRLAPYFLPEKGAPVVGNVAAILLQKGAAASPDALADRGLYQADWPGWTDAQRSAITQFARGFKPSWKLPAGRFSPWHFLVLDKKDNEKAFAYDKKVVVLIDRGCFSATDVFAAALGALPNVTLVGEATSGGSGRAAGHRLSKSGVRLQLSTMASFRPDGVLFEGNGVAPDVAVSAEAGDLVGAGDAVLQRALELLR